MFGLYDPGKETVTTNITNEKKNDPASHTVDLQKFQREYDESRHNIKKEIYEVLRENDIVAFTSKDKKILDHIKNDYASKKQISNLMDFIKDNADDIHEVRDRQKVHTWFIIGLIITTILLFFRRKK